MKGLAIRAVLGLGDLVDGGKGGDVGGGEGVMNESHVMDG